MADIVTPADLHTVPCNHLSNTTQGDKFDFVFKTAGPTPLKENRTPSDTVRRLAGKEDAVSVLLSDILASRGATKIMDNPTI